jgi:hypothetical protein
MHQQTMLTKILLNQTIWTINFTFGKLISSEIREGSVKVCSIEGSLAHADWGQCSHEEKNIAQGTIVHDKGGSLLFNSTFGLICYFSPT